MNEVEGISRKTFDGIIGFLIVMTSVVWEALCLCAILRPNENISKEAASVMAVYAAFCIIACFLGRVGKWLVGVSSLTIAGVAGVLSFMYAFDAAKGCIFSPRELLMFLIFGFGLGIFAFLERIFRSLCLWDSKFPIQ